MANRFRLSAFIEEKLDWTNPEGIEIQREVKKQMMWSESDVKSNKRRHINLWRWYAAATREASARAVSITTQQDRTEVLTFSSRISQLNSEHSYILSDCHLTIKWMLNPLLRTFCFVFWYYTVKTLILNMNSCHSEWNIKRYFISDYIKKCSFMFKYRFRNVTSF